jgi:hypothetical protein
MRQLIFTMHLKGELNPVGTSPNVMKASLIASEVCMSALGPNGRPLPLEPTLGEQATYESAVTFLGGFEVPEGTWEGEAGFKETGLISFGHGEHQLRFTTLGQGYIGPTAEPHLRQGAVLWQIESGEGQLKDATGLITSNFILSDAGDITHHQLGVLFVK